MAARISAACQFSRRRESGRRFSPAGSNGLVSSIVVACNVLNMLFLAIDWPACEARLKLDMVAVARRRESFSCEG